MLGIVDRVSIHDRAPAGHLGRTCCRRACRRSLSVKGRVLYNAQGAKVKAQLFAACGGRQGRIGYGGEGGGGGGGEGDGGGGLGGGIGHGSGGGDGDGSTGGGEGEGAAAARVTAAAGWAAARAATTAAAPARAVNYEEPTRTCRLPRCSLLLGCILLSGGVGGAAALELVVHCSPCTLLPEGAVDIRSGTAAD